MSSVLFVDCTLPTISSASGPQYVTAERGLITAMGPMSEAPSALRWQGDITNARGRSLVPGFVDAHAHVVESGVERLRCDMSSCDTRGAVLATVAKTASKPAENEWIVGRGWDLTLFDLVPPTLAEIDMVTRGRPAYLNNANGHCAWVNSEALLRAGIHEDSPHPPGGLIGRDTNGALNGMLYESAMNLVNDLIPPLSAAALTAGLVAGEKELHTCGVTAWQEAIVGPYVQTTDVYETLTSGEASGLLRGTVTGALWWPRGGDLSYVEQLVDLRDALPVHSRFRCTAVKIMYDGSPATRTAAMRDPYRGTSDRGITFFSREELLTIVAAVDRAGFDVHIHANGDRAASDSLDAIEGALRSNPARARRHQLAHLHFLDDDLISRMARLGVLAVVQPLWAHKSKKMMEVVLPSLTDDQAANIYRLNSLSKAGVMLASSSDWPVSTPDPLQAIHVAINRSHPAGARADPLLPSERLTVTSALHAATTGSAYAIRREQQVGRIAVGHAADLVLLDSTIGSENEEDIHAMRVDQTLIDGEVVFSRW